MAARIQAVPSEESENQENRPSSNNVMAASGNPAASTVQEGGASVNDENAEEAENRRPKFESKTKLKVNIRGWNGVATWKWIANDDTCGICRVAFDGCCPDCKLPGDDCPLVWGTCTHCFHIHCIVKWLNSPQAQQLCPMCRGDWKFKE